MRSRLITILLFELALPLLNDLVLEHCVDSKADSVLQLGVVLTGSY